MSKGWLLFFFSSLVCGMAVYHYPSLMLSPGTVLAGHEKIEDNCSACHSPLHGTPNEKCANCHKSTDIGMIRYLRSKSEGSTFRLPFHDSLGALKCGRCHGEHKGKHLQPEFDHSWLESGASRFCEHCHSHPPDMSHEKINNGCSSCHSWAAWKPVNFDHSQLTLASSSTCVDCHSAPRDQRHSLYPSSCKDCHDLKHWKPARFAHDALEPLIHVDCQKCHRAPQKDFHRFVPQLCANCHGDRSWKGAEFLHERLNENQRVRCRDCHLPPNNNMHKSFDSNCFRCHGVEGWRPSTFDHSAYFRLDRRHNVECGICHTNKTTDRYTCFGCHQHSPERIERIHREHSRGNLDRCADCHRSAHDGEHESEEHEGGEHRRGSRDSERWQRREHRREREHRGSWEED